MYAAKNMQTIGIIIFLELFITYYFKANHEYKIHVVVMLLSLKV